MNLMSTNLWTLAIRNLGRNRRRNLATGIAIALGFAALVALGGYLNRVHNYLRVYTLYMARNGHIVVYKRDGLEKYASKPARYSLTAQDQATLREIIKDMPNVELHGGQLIGMGLIGNGCRTLPFYATGIDPRLDRDLKRHPELARWLQAATGFTKGKGIWEYPEDFGALAIANGLARLLGKSHTVEELPGGGKELVIVDCLAPDMRQKVAADANVQLAAGSWSGMMSALDGEVVAHYNTGVTEINNSGILTALTHLQKLYDTENVTFYSLWLRNPGRLAQDVERVRTELVRRGVDADVYTWDNEDISPFYAGTMNFLKTMIGFLACVLATVAVFSIFNAATMTVIERSQEIGMMRSLGYTRGAIRKLFVREMVALAGFSVLAGGGIAAAGIAGVNAANIVLHPPGVAEGLRLMLMPNTLVVVAALVVIFGLAVLATLLAVRSVSKQNIALLLMGSSR